ncbi:MAG: hypothetical protein ACD_2C00162G0002 [uncultured bacterium (gcode 4)]|uniref:Uncharacterized protein n=1 Tax=uncultured bacterium (gcode 4) TaxID=1234023 RepID=K2G5D4_9BACT|nr:MAG: hypothetical protein ACD_2C00162G0002 [uncultured bacterium (gcode 4)]
MIKTKEAEITTFAINKNVEKALDMAEQYKDAFLEGKNALMIAKSQGKKITQKRLDRIFWLGNTKKEDLLKFIETQCNDSDFRAIRSEIEERSKTQWIEKWIYMELRAWLINIKNITS